MAVPQRKTSRSRKGKRRSHNALRIPNLSICPQCTEPKFPHRICPQCGTYKGKVFTEEKDLD
ncbi:MAG: 50S ribosomal protein L32 [Deltaproteobacteria bacterium]|nr:50S ribosomal protein L32 [Deltaproteobacteria bacterium]MDL1960510.1 50S ribosomal protein L32 [Deltaproteobacteria bacterium]